MPLECVPGPLASHPSRLERGGGDVAKTVVGGEGVRGCSGGERRRVTVGEQWAANTRALLADRLTDGLDSQATLGQPGGHLARASLGWGSTSPLSGLDEKALCHSSHEACWIPVSQLLKLLLLLLLVLVLEMRVRARVSTWVPRGCHRFGACASCVELQHQCNGCSVPTPGMA